MNKGIFIALIAVGSVFLVLGARASDSLSSDISRFFTDSPTDEAVWMLVGGGAALLVGLAGMARGGSRAT